MSKEHFWPDWLSSYIKVKQTDKNTKEFYSSEAKAPYILRSKNERPGNLISMKYRVVCETCNNGWMSQLEEKVKPNLICLIGNEPVILTKDDTLNISKWAVMKIIVAEQSQQEIQVTPEEDRNNFYKQKGIPEYFRVYIAPHTSKTESFYYRSSCTLALSPDGPSPPLNGMKRNVQTVGFLIGSLFVFVTAARVNKFYLEQRINFSQLQQIHPNSNDKIKWKELKSLDNVEVNNFIRALNALTSTSSVKYGGLLPN